MKKTISNGYLGSVYKDAKVSKVVIKGVKSNKWCKFISTHVR